MVKVEKYMNLIFITPPAYGNPCGNPVKSWINSIHLFKSVYHLMTDTSVQLCGQTQIRMLLISTLVKIEPSPTSPSPPDGAPPTIYGNLSNFH